MLCSQCFPTLSMHVSSRGAYLPRCSQSDIPKELFCEEVMQKWVEEEDEEQTQSALTKVYV